MSKTSDGTRDQPQFAAEDNPPTFSDDLTLISDFFAERSLRRFATVSALLASTGSDEDDYAIATNAPGAFWRHTGAGWVMYGVAHFTDDAARTAAIAAPAAGMRSRLTGNGRDYVYSGGAWVVVSPIACALRKTGNQNLTTSGVALVWDVEISDPEGMHDNSTNNTRITAPEPGLYEVSAMVFNSNSSGLGSVYGRLNGTTDIPGSLDRRVADASANLPLLTTFMLLLAAGDYVEIMVLHATAAGNIAGGTTLGAALVTMKRVL